MAMGSHAAGAGMGGIERHERRDGHSLDGRFRGLEDALPLNGDLRRTLVGADWARGRLIVGLRRTSPRHSRPLTWFVGAAVTMHVATRKNIRMRNQDENDAQSSGRRACGSGCCM